MIDRIERFAAHLFGWHSIACLDDLACAAPRGKVAQIGAGPLGWHRWIDLVNIALGQDGLLMTFDEVREVFGPKEPRRLCSNRNPRNLGMSCSLRPEHVDAGTDHRMGDGARWPVSGGAS